MAYYEDIYEYDETLYKIWKCIDEINETNKNDDKNIAYTSSVCILK